MTIITIIQSHSNSIPQLKNNKSNWTITKITIHHSIAIDQCEVVVHSSKEPDSYNSATKGTETIAQYSKGPQ